MLMLFRQTTMFGSQNIVPGTDQKCDPKPGLRDSPFDIDRI